MRFRFSLRTMLIVTTLVSVLMGLAANGVFTIYLDAERHQKAIESFSGRSFMCNGLSTNRGVFPGYSESSWVLLARKRIHPWAYAEMKSLAVNDNWSAVRPTFKQFRYVNGLEEFSGRADSFTKEDAKHINACPKLRECLLTTLGPVEPGAMTLVASNTKLKKFGQYPVDSETISAIAQNPSLIDVYIGGVSVTPSSIQLLGSSRSIERLQIMDSNVGVELIKPLTQMPQLKELELYMCKIDDEVLTALVRLKIESVVIKQFGTPLKMEITPLSKNPALRKLVIQSAFPRTDGDIASFAKCSKLEELDLIQTQVDAESLSALKNMPSLKSATFTGDLPDEVAQAFVDAVPGRELSLFETGNFNYGKVKKFTSAKEATLTTKKP